MGTLLEAIERGSVIGVLGAADAVLATKQLAERQTQALNAIRELHERETTLCIECADKWPCPTIRAINEAGA
ncbi:hypothetical protein BTO20_05850 [Mycobacterium dioxanotrophicus]|uniref:Uncharacterized protein n=1 Tax=Mycobacterium dioxanotrophicus TaxID=482462 RepID=A0A1Y0CDV4_9MYCO|nr:hypothetical protein BTO20_05850 [Mycobacterium dioxanotrophicus]